MSIKKALITGGAGFIGSNIAQRLVKEGINVRIIDNFSTGKIENLSEILHDIKLIKGDIRDNVIVKEAVKNVDIIYHYAAMASVQKSIENPQLCTDINVSGTLTLLNAAIEHKVEKFIFASSSSVYGDDPIIPKKENMIPSPLSPYAVTKLSSEHFCRIYSKLYNLKTICFRYFNIYGPRQDPDSEYSAVIPKFIKQLINKNNPVVYGDGTQSRDFIYIDDVAEYNLATISTDNFKHLVLNCACGISYNLIDLINVIKKELKIEINPIFKDERQGDIKHSYANIDKIIDFFNYKPKTSLEKGIIKLLYWFINNNEHK
jgi:nucleoside-diphosphate-sugar epimerase